MYWYCILIITLVCPILAGLDNMVFSADTYIIIAFIALTKIIK